MKERYALPTYLWSDLSCILFSQSRSHVNWLRLFFFDLVLCYAILACWFANCSKRLPFGSQYINPTYTGALSFPIKTIEIKSTLIDTSREKAISKSGMQYEYVAHESLIEWWLDLQSQIAWQSTKRFNEGKRCVEDADGAWQHPFICGLVVWISVHMKRIWGWCIDKRVYMQWCMSW